MWKTLRTVAHETGGLLRSGIRMELHPLGMERVLITITRTYMRIRRIIRVCSAPLQLSLVLFGLWGCSMMDPEQDIPSYLIVPELTFTPGEDQGTASTNITDLWVYSATDVVGIFPLPAVVPILPSDANGSPVTLLAGIRENGISNSRSPYPFYTTVEHVVDGAPGARDTLYPSVALVENVRFIPVEDFENSNVFGSLVAGSDMDRTGAEGEVFEGQKSGRMEVNLDAPLVRVRTVEQEYDLQGGVPVFLEFDYRCDQSFAVGLYGFRDGQETKHLTLVINPTEEVGGAVEWNKLYVDLASNVTAQGPADHFEVYFECILEAGRDAGSIGVDNVRILTY